MKKAGVILFWIFLFSLTISYSQLEESCTYDSTVGPVYVRLINDLPVIHFLGDADPTSELISLEAADNEQYLGNNKYSFEKDGVTHEVTADLPDSCKFGGKDQARQQVINEEEIPPPQITPPTSFLESCTKGAKEVIEELSPDDSQEGDGNVPEEEYIGPNKADSQCHKCTGLNVLQCQSAHYCEFKSGSCNTGVCKIGKTGTKSITILCKDENGEEQNHGFGIKVINGVPQGVTLHGDPIRDGACVQTTFTVEDDQDKCGNPTTPPQINPPNDNNPSPSQGGNTQEPDKPSGPAGKAQPTEKRSETFVFNECTGDTFDTMEECLAAPGSEKLDRAKDECTGSQTPDGSGDGSDSSSGQESEESSLCDTSDEECRLDSCVPSCEDACDDNCRMKDGYSCNRGFGATPSYFCTKEGECGDGVENLIEDCDDGNTIDGDGCDANCKVEDEEDTPQCEDAPGGYPPGSCYYDGVCLGNILESCVVGEDTCSDGSFCFPFGSDSLGLCLKTGETCLMGERCADEEWCGGIAPPPRAPDCLPNSNEQNEKDGRCCYTINVDKASSECQCYDLEEGMACPDVIPDRPRNEFPKPKSYDPAEGGFRLFCAPRSGCYEYASNGNIENFYGCCGQDESAAVVEYTHPKTGEIYKECTCSPKYSGTYMCENGKDPCTKSGERPYCCPPGAFGREAVYTRCPGFPKGGGSCQANAVGTDWGYCYSQVCGDDARYRVQEDDYAKKP